MKGSASLDPLEKLSISPFSAISFTRYVENYLLRMPGMKGTLLATPVAKRGRVLLFQVKPTRGGKECIRTLR